MREIKFRAFDRQRKVMWQPCTLLSNYNKTTGGYTSEYAEFVYMQYTGLKDKYGKEIYEKDIINTADGACLVCWNEKLATFVLAKDGWMYDHYFGEAVEPENCKVIGNSYENPELLEGDKT